MKLTKFDHACFTVEKEGSILVVDPGNLTANLVRQRNVAGIIITHEHADHFDPRIVTAILDENPEAVIYTTADVAPQLSIYDVHTPRAGERHSVGPFTVRFFGGEHATIHTNVATPNNIAVMIDESLYYPGDSFTLPDHTVKALLLPVAAPWMKIAEAIDFAARIRPGLVIPTHDAILSQNGIDIVDSLLQTQTALYGGQYQRLTQSIEVESA